MSKIIYKKLVFDQQQILFLYKQNNWTSYTNEPHSLFQGIAQSLDTIGAYHNQSLVGLIRTVGDGNTIVYVQDILVLPKYHRQGIGTRLLKTIINKYPHVRQLVLMTDISIKTKYFYESMGFIQYQDANCVGFLYKYKQ